MSKFKENTSFEDRKKGADKIRSNYPDKIPIILEKTKNNNIPELDRHKYLIPNDFTVGQFMFVIRKRIKLGPEQALFLFVNNTIPHAGMLISLLYKEHKDEDGFLYMTVSGEATFGSL